MSVLPSLAALYGTKEENYEGKTMKYDHDSSKLFMLRASESERIRDDNESIITSSTATIPSSSSFKSSSPSSTNRQQHTTALVLITLFLAVCVTGYTSYHGFPPVASILPWSGGDGGAYLSSDARSNPDIPTLSTDQLRLTATNEYGVFDAPYPWLQDGTGSQLVEPFKLTTLTASGPFVDQYPPDDLSFNWLIEKYEGDQSSHKPYIDVTLKRSGNYDIRVQVMNKHTNQILAVYSTRLMCRYVKREIRTLTIPDRERLLDAMAALWQYNQEDGFAKFGDRFTSIHTFVAAHSMASNDIMCDQFHEGTGFLTHHLALTNSFEASIRAVDPSVTLPYWDFTIEGQTIANLDQKPSYLLEITPVFTDEWFGSVDEHNHIADSRWAHSPMPMQTDTDSGVRNSYGYIRSYWNNNPDPEVSRRLFDACGVEPVHKKIPSCKNHYDLLDAPTLGDFLMLSPADGHGPMHVQLGGMWGGCTEAYQSFYSKWAHVLEANVTNKEVQALGYRTWKWGMNAPRKAMVETAIMGEYFHIYRSFWRSHMCAEDGTPGLLVCPDTCSQDMPFEECACEVKGLLSGETSWRNILPCMLNSAENRDFFERTMPDELLEDLAVMMSTAPVLEGEMIESASTADVLFWIIHPGIERLLAAKRLPAVTAMNGAPFTQWADVSGMNETWLHYSYYDLKKKQNPFMSDAYACYGHQATDLVFPVALPLTETIERGVDMNEDGIVTNWEFFRALDPNLPDNNDYVFDNFDWDHCDNLQGGR